MKLTYIALLGSMLAFTACDSGPEDNFGGAVEDPRIESNTTAPNPNNQTMTRSGSSSSQTANQGSQSAQGQADDLPPVPPRSEEVEVDTQQPRN